MRVEECAAGDNLISRSALLRVSKDGPRQQLRTRLLILAARFARALHIVSLPRKSRVQGRPGGRCTRGLAQKEFAQAQEPQVQAVITPALPARWFTAYGALSSVNLADCHRPPRCACASSALAPSLWGARTTRFHRPRRCRTSDSINPSTAFRPTFVTTRTPLVPERNGES